MKDIFDQTKILVVGGAGFVGSNLCDKLLSYNIKQLVVIDNLLSAERSNLAAGTRLEFIEGSISDDKIVGALKDDFDFIFHLATYHGNQSSIFDPIADHENNTLTSLKLFNKIREFKNLKKVVYAGAGCAVAEKTFENAKATEESDLVHIDGDSPYSLSKIFGEYYAKYFHKQYKTPIVRARFQNVYGPKEILGAGQWRGTPATVWRNVTPTLIWKALQNAPLTIENQGIATRDFIFVDDIVEGLIRLAAYGAPPEAYNLATGTETSIRTLAETILKVTNSSSTLSFLPRREWDNSGMRFGSTDKSSKQIGFTAAVPLEEGITRTVEWTIKNAPLISMNIEKHRERM